MERWQFALPVQFERHLPPLIESVQRMDGQGDWRSDVAREKLRTVVKATDAGDANDDKAEIVDRELRFGGQPFRAEKLLAWQKRRWQAEAPPAKDRKTSDPYSFSPVDATVHVLAGLDAGLCRMALHPFHQQPSRHAGLLALLWIQRANGQT